MSRKRSTNERILSAGVVVVRPEGSGLKYLLLRAYDYWDFPKGMVEAGESPLQAAIREVEEESAISDLQFSWGHVYRQTQPYNQGRKVARYYIAETQTVEVSLLINPLLGHPEHSEYRWVTRDEAWGLLTPRVRAILKWVDGVLAHSNGATANGALAEAPSPQRAAPSPVLDPNAVGDGAMVLTEVASPKGLDKRGYVSATPAASTAIDREV